MLKKMIQRFLFLPVLLLFLPAVAFCSDSPRIVVLDYQDADQSEASLSRRFAARFQMFARNAVPANSKTGWLTHIKLASPESPEQFSVNVRPRKRELDITVPARYSWWKEDAAVHNWLMSIFLLAQLGYPFDREKQEKPEFRFRDHWFVRGLARKASEWSVKNLSHPLVRTTPGAYVLTSNGLTPTLEQVTRNGVLPETYRYSAALSAEYAELLVDACAHAGLFRAGLAEGLLQVALASPETSHAETLVGVLAQLRVNRNSTAADPAVWSNNWFRSYVEQVTLNRLAPLSMEYFEVKYNQAAIYDFTAADGIPRTCRISNLLENWPLFAAGNLVIDTLIERLKLLTFTAPESVQDELAGIRAALSRCRTDQTPEAALQLQNAERALYARISRTVETQNSLKEAERRHISPVDRLQNTIRAARLLREEEQRMLPEIQKILDRWDDCR